MKHSLSYLPRPAYTLGICLALLWALPGYAQVTPRRAPAKAAKPAGQAPILKSQPFTPAQIPAPVAERPTIRSIYPASAPTGAKVRIRGNGLSRMTTLLFGNIPAQATYLSGDTLITAIVPERSISGPITVNANGLTAQSATIFSTQKAPFLEMLSYTPNSGAIGTPVTITGMYLLGAKSVKFNGVAADYKVVSDSLIQTTVPMGATPGKLSIEGPYNLFTDRGHFDVLYTSTGQTEGLDETATEDIATVNPNPSTDRTVLTYSHANPTLTYALTGYTRDGREVLRAQIVGSDLIAGYTLQYSLPRGIYTLTLVTSDGTERRIRLDVDK